MMLGPVCFAVCLAGSVPTLQPEAGSTPPSEVQASHILKETMSHIGVAGGLDSNEGIQVLFDDISSARHQGRWADVEVLSRFGFDAFKGKNEAIASDFLSSASEALSMLAMQAIHDPNAPEPNIDAMMLTAKQTRELATQRLRSLLDSPNPDISSATYLLLTLGNTRTTATMLDQTETLAQWEEQDGDLIASLPLDIQSQLSEGFRPDDYYFRAASAHLKRHPDDLAEVERLLTKIDALGFKRKDSSFHAATLADDLNTNSSPKIAYAFSLKWFQSHADEPSSGWLLSRVVALAMMQVSPTDQNANTLMRRELGDLETRYGDVARRFDRQHASQLLAANAGLEDPKPIANWEQHVIESQFLLDQIMFAEMNGDPDLVDLASRFVTTYPQHPGIEPVNQMLRTQVDSRR